MEGNKLPLVMNYNVISLLSLDFELFSLLDINDPAFAVESLTRSKNYLNKKYNIKTFYWMGIRCVDT